MPSALHLRWLRCADGYEIRDYGKDPEDDRQVGEYVIVRSAEINRLHFTFTAGSDDPLVLKFIDAKTPGELLKFVNEYGLPGGMGFEHEAYDANWTRGYEGHEPHPLADIRLMQRELETAINESGTDVFELLAFRGPFRLALASAKKGPPQLELHASSLYAMMLAEIALIKSGGGLITSCMNCGTLFVAGGGGKRSGSIYCSSNCKVAAHRARKKG